MNQVIPGFPIYIDRAKFLTEFDRQDQAGASRGDAAVHRVVRVVERNLREDGDSQSGIFIVIETPFHSELILSEAVLGRSRKIVHSQPGIFEGELDAVAKTEIDIDIGRMSDGLLVVKERHVTQIDFPLKVSRGAWIVRVVWWCALGKRGRKTQKRKAKAKKRQSPRFSG